MSQAVEASEAIAGAAVAGGEIPESPAQAPRRACVDRPQRREHVERIVRLDRRFAYLTSFLPLAGTLVAVGLVLAGHPVGWTEIGLLVVMYSLSTIGLEVGWHRLFAHRAFETTRGVRVLLAILGSFAFQGPVVWWVATHRRHHGLSDQPGDPHSPRPAAQGLRARLAGIYQAHSGWTFDPARARPAGWAEYAKDLYQDEAVFRIHYRYFLWMTMGLVLPAVVGGLVSMSFTGAALGLLWGGFVRIFLGDHAVRALNSIAHVFGTREFHTNDLSRNNVWLVLPTFGQGWHHNHHAFPRAAIMSRRWWQIDPGGWVIRTLELARLAWNVRLPRADIVEARRVA